MQRPLCCIIHEYNQWMQTLLTHCQINPLWARMSSCLLLMNICIFSAVFLCCDITQAQDYSLMSYRQIQNTGFAQCNIVQIDLETQQLSPLLLLTCLLILWGSGGLWWSLDSCDTLPYMHIVYLWTLKCISNHVEERKENVDNLLIAELGC